MLVHDLRRPLVRLPRSARSCLSAAAPLPCLFGTTHRARPKHFASSALGRTSTNFTSATPTSSSAQTNEPLRVETLRRSLSPEQATSNYAPRSSSEAAPESTTEKSLISALFAEATITERLQILERRRSSPHTPLNADAWALTLSNSGLLPKYNPVLTILRHGADAGISSIQTTFSPPNSSSVSDNSQLFESLMLHEFEAGRFCGPFTAREVEDALQSPFQTSPISLVPKPNSNPQKFRPVNNLSYPHKPIPRPPHYSLTSINYSIDADNYPCTWGTFAVCTLLIARLPPGSQGAVRDVSEAYRRVPIAPSQWPGTVVRLSPELFAINIALLFGLVSSGGVWGLVADALCAILRASGTKHLLLNSYGFTNLFRLGIGPLCKWVDDFIFFRILIEFIPEYNRRQEKWAARIRQQGGFRQSNSCIWFAGGTLPDGSLEEYDNDLSSPVSSQHPVSASHPYAYDIANVDAITSPLGVPWAKEKDQPFSFCPTYIGFFWDLQARTVGIPEKKKEKYRAAIAKWQSADPPVHDLKETQELHGKLQHAAHVLPSGRAYLTSLESFMGTFGDRPHKPRRPPRSTAGDLAWWFNQLSRPKLQRSIPGPSQLLDVRAFSDASSSTGIGIVIGGAWRAWELQGDWKRENRDIAWAEAIGFELLVRTLLPTLSPGSHIKVYGDNKVVIEGWKRGASRNVRVNDVFKRIHVLQDEHDCYFHARYLQSSDNPADNPSRGIYPKGPLLPAPSLPSVPDFGFLRLVSEKEISQASPAGRADSLAKTVSQESFTPDDDILDDVAYELLQHSNMWDFDISSSDR